MAQTTIDYHFFHSCNIRIKVWKVRRYDINVRSRIYFILRSSLTLIWPRPKLRFKAADVTLYKRNIKEAKHIFSAAHVNNLIAITSLAPTSSGELHVFILSYPYRWAHLFFTKIREMERINLAINLSK